MTNVELNHMMNCIRKTSEYSYRPTSLTKIKYYTVGISKAASTVWQETKNAVSMNSLCPSGVYLMYMYARAVISFGAAVANEDSPITSQKNL